MIDWLLSILWYGSFFAMIIGVVAMLRPIRRLRLGARWRGAVLVILAAALVLTNATCAPREQRVFVPATQLDDASPAYHFREVHTRTIEASPARVLAAIKTVSADEIALFELFTTIRRFGRRGPESILNAPANESILDVATRSGFFLLADDGREIVLGSFVVVPPGFRPDKTPDARWFRELSQPGVVKATMNFFVEGERAERTRLTTETRVVGTDEIAVRRFTPYWRTIFPGSWILRATWLSAIARRAEP